MSPESVPAGASATARGAQRIREALLYLGAVLTTVLALPWALQLKGVDLSVPLYYTGDAASAATGIKTLVNTGWYLDNPLMGAPGVSHLQDYPGTDNLHLLIVKLIGMTGVGWAMAMNLFFLLTFPLVTLAAVWAARRLGLSRPMAYLVSVLYAFLPYHALRGEAHLWLAAYYLVPLAIVLLKWASETAPFPWVPGKDAQVLASPGRVFGALLICVLLGAGGIYYAFFTCVFLVVVGVFAVISHRSWALLWSALALAAVIVVASVVNLAPTFVFRAQNGPNREAGKRQVGEAFAPSLKLAEMLMPVQGHRVGAFAKISDLYRAGLEKVAPKLEGESLMSSLGIVGSLGLLVLLLAGIVFPAMRAGPRSDAGETVRLFTALTWAGFLLATLGGFGLLLNVLLPGIRAYNRIVVFLAFFAFIVVGIGADRFVARYVVAPRSRTVWAWVLAIALLAFGLFDMVPAAPTAYAASAAAFDADGAFFKKVEAVLPQGAMVFELPYVAFPEGGQKAPFEDYALVRPFLHSDKLRWSFGAVRGRPVARWQRRVSRLPAPQMVTVVREAGFSAILVDRESMPRADAENLATEIRTQTGTAALSGGENDRWIVIPLEKRSP